MESCQQVCVDNEINKVIDQQILIAIAQIAITLSGFSGVVGIFDGGFDSRRRHELKTLLQQSGIALFASLTPLIFSSQTGGSYSAGNYELFWIISSSIYICICAVFMVVWGREILSREHHKSLNYDLVFYLSFFGVIAMLGVNVVWVRDGYLYNIALAINLAYGFMTFVRLVTAAKRQSD